MTVQPEPTRPAQPSRHDHAWHVESRHTTSLGTVCYVRCTTCGTRRVDLRRHPHLPPAPLTTARPPR